MSADEGLRAIRHWIDGKPWLGEAARTGEVFDPATGARQALVDFAEPAEVDAAVRAARRAFATWRRVSLARRTSVMFAFRQLLAERTDELAAIITAEHGKVASDAAGEIARGVENVEYACGLPEVLKGGFSQHASTGVDVHSIRQPLGVVGVISPFNFPAMVPLWFVPNAIACGNTVVLKPSEKDPSAAVWLAELFAEAGLPEGVLNVVHGDKVAVDALLAHEDVRAVSFVGSTPIARYVYETGTRHGKRVQALGGAKNHMVVLPDADLDQAADAAVSAGFGSAGERCMAVSVVVAVDPVGDDLVARVKSRMADLRVGDGRSPPRRWARWSPRRTATRCGRSSTRARARARRWPPTAATIRSRVRSPASGSVRRCSTTSPRRWRSTARRSSGRCSASCGRRATTRRSRSSTRTPTATARRSSPATAARHAGSPRRSRSAWSA